MDLWRGDRLAGQRKGEEGYCSRMSHMTEICPRQMLPPSVTWWPAAFLVLCSVLKTAQSTSGASVPLWRKMKSFWINEWPFQVCLISGNFTFDLRILTFSQRIGISPSDFWPSLPIFCSVNCGFILGILTCNRKLLMPNFAQMLNELIRRSWVKGQAIA